MVNHAITIAKAAFAAACLRPDVGQLTREDIGKFHTLFEATLVKCSPYNVQTCKEWLIQNIIQSPPRTAALTRFFAISADNDEHRHQTPGQVKETNILSRKGLHILYLLNDVLHHVKYHYAPNRIDRNLEDSLRSHLPSLVQSTRLHSGRSSNRRLDTLLNIWEDEEYFSSALLAQMRQGLKENDSGAERKASIVVSPAKEMPYIMPSTHGDPATRYYDLPAANLMPHIVPNKAVPIRPDQITALQLSAGPAEETLVSAMRDFLKDVERIDNPHQSLEDDGIIASMDELGQLSYVNEADEQVYDTYYGWSKEFCEKMKNRSKGERKKLQRGRSAAGSSRSTSRSRSDSISRSPDQRRRYSRSRSRSPVPRSRYRSSSRTRLRSWSRNGHSATVRTTQPSMVPHDVNPSMPLVAPQWAYPQLPLGHGAFTIPPRPPNYHGPWPPLPPPPPPPLPATSMNLSFSMPPPPPHSANGPYYPKRNDQGNKP